MDKSSGVYPSDVNLLYCRRLVHLDGQVVWEKSSFQTAKYQTIFSLKSLFVPFAHQTICSYETICPSRRFVRPLMWKRPMMHWSLMKHQNINPRHNFVSLLAWRVIPLFVVLQAFIRDAEYVDSLSASHEAFLSNDDLGVFTNLLCLSFKQH